MCEAGKFCDDPSSRWAGCHQTEEILNKSNVERFVKLLLIDLCKTTSGGLCFLENQFAAKKSQHPAEKMQNAVEKRQHGTEKRLHTAKKRQHIAEKKAAG